MKGSGKPGRWTFRGGKEWKKELAATTDADMNLTDIMNWVQYHLGWFQFSSVSVWVSQDLQDSVPAPALLRGAR